jgi:hypothetical protein
MAALEAAIHLASVREPMTLLRPPTRTHWMAGSSPAMTLGMRFQFIQENAQFAKDVDV